jgi:hypothetical protein
VRAAGGDPPTLSVVAAIAVMGTVCVMATACVIESTVATVGDGVRDAADWEGVAVGVGSRTISGARVGVMVGKSMAAGVGVSTIVPVSGAVCVAVGVTETSWATDNTGVTLTTDVVVSAAVGWLESGPTRAGCCVSGGGVSGRVTRAWRGGVQFANNRIAMMSSARLLIWVRDSMNGSVA